MLFFEKYFGNLLEHLEKEANWFQCGLAALAEEAQLLAQQQAVPQPLGANGSVLSSVPSAAAAAVEHTLFAFFSRPS